MVSCFIAFSVEAQTETARGKTYRNYPIVITIQFHSLALPFRDLKTNFSNIGFGLGTEVSHNGRHNWAQQFSLVWYRNKAVGNGLLLYTQAAWRPTIVSDIYSEVKAGIGYLVSFRPVESFKMVDKRWVSVGRKGKGMLVLPVGVSLGHNDFSSETYLSPFVSYQFLLLKDYNKSIPIVPETLIQVGSRIHLD